MTLRALSVAVLALLAAPAAARADELIVSRPGGLTAAELARAGVTAEKDLPLPGVELVEAGDDAAAALRALRADPDVEWAEPNQRVHAAAGTDPFSWELWGLDKISAPAAWSEERGAAATVAVVDSGADLDHEDLEDQLVPGRDFVATGTDPDDEYWHGTHITGTIVAPENGVGVVGVAPETRAMPLRALNHNGQGSTADIALAFDYAADAGIRVVNASLGFPMPSRFVREAIERSPDTLFVVPSGNSGSTSVEYPCANSAANVLCVGATDESDSVWGNSNYSATSVDLFAPGVDIKSTIPGGYGSADGTSIAAAHVSGVAALVAAEHPAWRAASIKAAILAGADPLANLAGKSVTGARLNARGALDAAAQLPETEPDPPAPPPTPPAPAPDPAPPAPAPAPPAATPAPPVAVAPAARVSRLRVSGTRTARLSFSLSTAATVTIRVERRRCSNGRCSWRRAAGRRHAGRAGTQRLTVGRKLTPGVWRVTVAAPGHASRRVFRVRSR